MSSDEARARMRAERAEDLRIEDALTEFGAEFINIDTRLNDIAGTDERIRRVRAFFEAVPNVRDGQYSMPWWANPGQCLHGLTRNANGNYRQGRQVNPSEVRTGCPMVSQIEAASGIPGVGYLYDHMNYLLIADSRRVWLTEPYMETPPEVARHIEEAFRVGSDGALGAVVLGSEASWWNPPATTLIAIAEPPVIEIIANAMRR